MHRGAPSAWHASRFWDALPHRHSGEQMMQCKRLHSRLSAPQHAASASNMMVCPRTRHATCACENGGYSPRRHAHSARTIAGVTNRCSPKRADGFLASKHAMPPAPCITSAFMSPTQACMTQGAKTSRVKGEDLSPSSMSGRRSKLIGTLLLSRGIAVTHKQHP